MPKALIFDVGAHRGDDSFVYLKQGYRVVAVEANELLTAELQKRFQAEIKAGDFSIVHCAVSSTDDQCINFYLARDTSRSSVFESAQAIATKVQTQRLDTLFAKFGEPFYCKIDIEGSDLVALHSIGNYRPSWVSVEVSGHSVAELEMHTGKLFDTLEALHQFGYTQFKLVDQENLIVLSRQSYYRNRKTIPGGVREFIWKKFRLSPRDHFRRKFHLPADSELSGYSSNGLGGVWSSYAEAKDLLAFHFAEYREVCRDKNLIFWVDIHAGLGT